MSDTLPGALICALQGDRSAAGCSAPAASWSLALTLSLPRTLTVTLRLTRTGIRALISVLQGDHGRGVASGLKTSLDRSLTLAMAVSPRGPHSSISELQAPGAQKRCRIPPRGTQNITESFPGLGWRSPGSGAQKWSSITRRGRWNIIMPFPGLGWSFRTRGTWGPVAELASRARHVGHQHALSSARMEVDQGSRPYPGPA